MARYIDADALKNDGHLCYHDGKGNTYYEVDHAPTADVAEVKHGEWVETADYGESKVVQCTSCEEDFWFKKKGQLNIDKMPHCPKCGAKMDGGNDHGKKEQTSKDI